MGKNKFNFYEIVEIQPLSGVLDLSNLDTRKFDYQTLVGKKGTIMAMVENDDNIWLYEVMITDTEDTYTIQEQDLVPTGKTARREDFYDGEVIHVKVDPDTGEGLL